ncbi:hypothetical protein ACFYO9_35225 [Streptomyces sp. NPDC005863]|uniref:hypothetical protein n=1 Tax=unclassified Streptomyces TaxID=2593676 RepID=UPI0033E0755E
MRKLVYYIGTSLDGPPARRPHGRPEPPLRHGPKDIWLCGGGRVAAALLPELDELIVKSYPVVAGAGVPVFAGEFDPTRFRVTAREEFPSGVLMTWFEALR